MPISWTESPSPRTCEVTSTIDQLLSHLHHSQQPGYPPASGKRSNCAFRVLDSRRSNGRRSSLDCSSTSITRHVVSVVSFTQPCACSSAISKCNRRDDSTSQMPDVVNAVPVNVKYYFTFPILRHYRPISARSRGV